MANKPIYPEKPSKLSQDQARKTPAEYHAKIAKAAYYVAESRGFAAGHDLEDWFTAKRAVMGKGARSR